MSVREDGQAAKRIVQSVRTAFPEEAALVDAIFSRDGYEDADFTWVERFSQLTTDAITDQDFLKAAAHLKLLSRLLAVGDEATIRCIDVAYVESFMWDIKDDKLRKYGWSLLPPNLKSLYIDMWGEKPFMKVPYEG